MARSPISTGSARKRASPRTFKAAAALLLAVAWLPAAAATHILPPDEAFPLSVRALDDHTLEARFDIVDGYYLYRPRISFAIEPAAAGPITPELSAGTMKHDEFFGDVEIYRGPVVARLPLATAQPGANVVLTVTSQGCADAGVCFPPQIQTLTLPVPAAGGGPTAFVHAGAGKLPWMK
ncbi:MAG: hypothetical protein JSR18_14930 [Proteobacteria bacterium]|nr:hypothetical protein [Pseudomonadota bacterium]